VPVDRVLHVDAAVGRVAHEMRGLSQQWPLARGLPEPPRDHVPASRGVYRKQPTRLLRQVQQDRPGFEQRERPAAWAFGVDQRRDLPVRVHQRVGFAVLIACADVDPPHLVGQADLLEHHQYLASIGRGVVVKLDHLVRLRRQEQRLTQMSKRSCMRSMYATRFFFEAAYSFVSYLNGESTICRRIDRTRASTQRGMSPMKNGLLPRKPDSASTSARARR